MTPEERNRKAREYYHKNAERERAAYRRHYARNREKEVEKTRRYKTIKKYGLDPAKWREQWQEIQDYRIGKRRKLPSVYVKDQRHNLKRPSL